MNKNRIFTAMAAAVTLTAGFAFAEESNMNMEKCKVMKGGNGLIKEHKTGDAESWIMVPKGKCEKSMPAFTQALVLM